MSSLRWSLLIIGGLLLLGIYLYGRWRGQTRPSEIFDDIGHAETDILMGKRGDANLRENLSTLKDASKTELFADLGGEPAKEVKIDLRPSDLKGSLKPLSDQPAVKPKILKTSSALPSETMEKASTPKEMPKVNHIEGDVSSNSQPEKTPAKKTTEAPQTGQRPGLSPKKPEEKPAKMPLRNEARAEKESLVADEHVVVMHIVAPKNKPFKGKAVLKAFHANGLRFGDMNIFHRVTKRNGEIFTVFSLASMVKPGTLNPKEMVDSSLQGLSLFTRLPNPVGSIVAFDEMLHCAQHIASTLGGELRDQKLRPMTHGSIMVQRGNLRKRFPEKK